MVHFKTSCFSMIFEAKGYIGVFEGSWAGILSENTGARDLSFELEDR